MDGRVTLHRVGPAYVRFECGWAYEHTVDAGEDVRLIPVPGADWPAALPHYDYWLFGSSQLVAM
ncbi:DUF6879 family protein [Micromonospora sp. CPCC 205539]|uniref:DUF6879 family protein n=1 Tax=Micromonospora sp. CPCC 205539 TaxID=3122408 RepID=UPI002FEFCDAB